MTAVFARLAEVISAFALALWVGGLWTVGFVVAPTLFRMLDERALAGTVAGALFTQMAYIGLGCGAWLAAHRIAVHRAAAVRGAVLWILAAMLVLTALNEFGVSPVLAALREQAGPGQVMDWAVRERFAGWHALSAGLYVATAVLGAALAALQARGR